MGNQHFVERCGDYTYTYHKVKRDRNGLKQGPGQVTINGYGTHNVRRVNATWVDNVIVGEYTVEDFRPKSRWSSWKGVMPKNDHSMSVPHGFGVGRSVDGHCTGYWHHGYEQGQIRVVTDGQVETMVMHRGKVLAWTRKPLGDNEFLCTDSKVFRSLDNLSVKDWLGVPTGFGTYNGETGSWQMLRTIKE